MSRESLWADVLAEFKATEVDEAVLFVIEDGWLRRAIAAWSVLPHLRRPDDYRRTAVSWPALWEGVEFDLPLYAQHLDTFEGHAQQLFDRARALMLIYPDGSVHTKALKIIKGAVEDAVKEESEEE